MVSWTNKIVGSLEGTEDMVLVKRSVQEYEFWDSPRYNHFGSKKNFFEHEKIFFELKIFGML